MVEYFWLFVKYHQDDWVDWQPVVQFVANNRVSETTICILLYTLHVVDLIMVDFEVAMLRL